MKVLVLSSEPRPHGPWHTPARHAGCLTHWVQLHLGPEDVVIYPWMFVRGYAMVIEVQTGKRLREILQGNPMWMDETYKLHILEEEGTMSASSKVAELPAVPGMNRFLILARLAKPVPPTVDFEGTDKLLAKMSEQHGAQVYRLVEDVGGYAIFVNVRDHDQLRELLEPLPITTFVNYQIIPLGTMGGHKKHLADLGHNISFEAPRP
jgi:muconolactone delta-isomerase